MGLYKLKTSERQMLEPGQKACSGADERPAGMPRSAHLYQYLINLDKFAILVQLETGSGRDDEYQSHPGA
jgi:hypothetical protein